MANELDIHRGSTERISTGPELASGQYWRSKHDVPARVDTYERDKRSWFGDEASKGERELATMHARRAVAGDLVLLVKSLKIVDGDLHTVELAAHPLDKEQSSLRFLVDEFFANFEHADDAADVRSSELAAISGEIAALQTEIIAGPPDLPALPGPGIAADVTSLVKMAAQADKLEEKAAQHLVVAQQRAKWIQERTGAIGGKVEVMARFHQERAVAALASVETTIRHVEKIQKGLRSLKLYTGEGVFIEDLATGPSAPADEPLTIYQRRLFADEELAVLMSKGGIDSETLDDFAYFVQQNPSFIDRVAPAPRSIVLLNLRRRANVPEEVRSLAEALEAIAKAKLDTAAFLLIRNGANLHLVWSDLLWSYEGKRDDFDANGLVRLFPSRGDLDQPFRGVDGREINVESLDYTDARSRFDDRGLAYKRLLILLWGLNDRLNLFGEFYDRSRYEAWTDANFQAERFRFIADDELGLVENRADVFKWVRSKNDYLQAGSRVLCSWGSMVNEVSAPGCYKWHDRSAKYEEIAHPVSATGLEVVKERSGDLVVSVEVRDLRNSKRRSSFVNLLANSDDRHRIGYICLDAISLAEIDRYIESRRDREHYLEYLSLFIEVRKILADEATRQEPARAEMLAAIAAAKLAEPAAAERAVDEAIRLWRADHSGELVPSGTESRRTFNSVLNTAFVLLGRDVQPELVGGKVAEAIGRVPLRVSVNGDGYLVLYSVPHTSELKPQLGRQYWVHKVVLDRKRAFPYVDGHGFGELRSVQPSESVLFEWPSAREWTLGWAPARLSYEDMEALIEQIDAGGVASTIFPDGVRDDPFFFETVRRRVREASKKRKGYVERVEYRIPLGLVNWSREPHVVYLEEDPVFMFARGSEKQQAVVASWFRDTYKSPEAHLEGLAGAVAHPRARLVVVSLEAWRKDFRNDPHVEAGLHGLHYFGQGRQEQGWRESIRKSAPTRQVRGEQGGFSYELPPFEETMLYLAPGAEAVLDALAAKGSETSAV